MHVLVILTNFLKEIKHGMVNNLKYLDLAENNMKQINLSDMSELETLDISNNRINALNLHDLKLIKSASIFGNESLQPQISETQLDNIRVDSAQYIYLEKTGQLAFFEYIDNYKLDRYFLKRTLK